MRIVFRNCGFCNPPLILSSKGPDHMVPFGGIQGLTEFGAKGPDIPQVYGSSQQLLQNPEKRAAL